MTIQEQIADAPAHQVGLEAALGQAAHHTVRVWIDKLRIDLHRREMTNMRALEEQHTTEPVEN